jgi:hypothetical protein
MLTKKTTITESIYILQALINAAGIKMNIRAVARLYLAQLNDIIKRQDTHRNNRFQRVTFDLWRRSRPYKTMEITPGEIIPNRKNLRVAMGNLEHFSIEFRLTAQRDVIGSFLNSINTSECFNFLHEGHISREFAGCDDGHEFDNKIEGFVKDAREKVLKNRTSDPAKINNDDQQVENLLAILIQIDQHSFKLDGRMGAGSYLQEESDRRYHMANGAYEIHRIVRNALADENFDYKETLWSISNVLAQKTEATKTGKGSYFFGGKRDETTKQLYQNLEDFIAPQIGIEPREMIKPK